MKARALVGWLAVDGCVALLLAASAVAHAQGYPSRPVRLVVPTSPGGGTDISARMLAPKLAEYLGQQIVVDNRPGASTMIGVELVARAAPDGYTLLMGISSLAIAPYIQTKVPYDAVKDFAPVSQVVVLPNLMVSHPSLPARSVKELVAFARTRPGQINFAAGSVGSNPHLAMELFLSMTGLKMVHVPYKGQGPALIDLMAGHVSLSMANMLSALPHVKNGRLRAIGVTGAKRASIAPDVPIIADAEIVLEGWIRKGDKTGEGPFGEWTGYLVDQVTQEPFLKVERVLYRNDPIILGAPPAKPPHDYSYMRTIMKSAMIFDALVAAGIPEVKGVYAPECGGGRMLVIVAIKQRYAGHARQAGFIASQCREAAYMGKYTVVVDEDIDVTNLEEVLWAICTRTDPATSIDFIRRAWASKAEPMLRPGQPPFNSRAIIDACRPYEWFDDFPKVAQADPVYLRELEQKWRDIFPGRA